jgi:hypothetical protein
MLATVIATELMGTVVPLHSAKPPWRSSPVLLRLASMPRHPTLIGLPLDRTIYRSHHLTKGSVSDSRQGTSTTRPLTCRGLSPGFPPDFAGAVVAALGYAVP